MKCRMFALSLALGALLCLAPSAAALEPQPEAPAPDTAAASQTDTPAAPAEEAAPDAAEPAGQALTEEVTKEVTATVEVPILPEKPPIQISYTTPEEIGFAWEEDGLEREVLETAPVTAGERELQAVLPQFVGKQMQVPPMYSAVKVGGQPLYKLAREGKTVERKARPIEIYSITYGGSPAENEYVLEVTCSKGTYIRTLLEDIADALGQKGTMSALRRTCAGLYTEADAHTLEEILAAKEQGPAALEALMLPVESVFTPLPLLVVEPWVEQHLYNGCPTSRYPAADGRYRVRNAAGQFLGLANITGGVLRVEKLFVERN